MSAASRNKGNRAQAEARTLCIRVGRWRDGQEWITCDPGSVAIAPGDRIAIVQPRTADCGAPRPGYAVTHTASVAEVLPVLSLWQDRWRAHCSDARFVSAPASPELSVALVQSPYLIDPIDRDICDWTKPTALRLTDVASAEDRCPKCWGRGLVVGRLPDGGYLGDVECPSCKDGTATPAPIPVSVPDGADGADVWRWRP